MRFVVLPPGTLDDPPRRCAGAGPDAMEWTPAWARARSWSEPLMVLGSESAGPYGDPVVQRWLYRSPRCSVRIQR